MMKRPLLVGLALLLSGCALPPTLMMASTAVEGTSAIATGKTASDYAISAIAGRDCTLLYGLTRGRICEEAPAAEKEFSAAMADLPPSADIPAVPLSSSPGPDEKEAAPDGGHEPAWTLVLATVGDYGQAVVLARRLQPKPGLITAVEVDGKVAYRVTTEPFRFEDAVSRQRQVASQDFANAVLTAVCPYWMKDEKCIVLDRVLPL